MSNSNFRDVDKEDHDNDDDGDRNSDQEQLELRKDEEEFVDEDDKKEEELVDVNDDFVELSKDKEEFVDEGSHRKDEELVDVNDDNVELSKDDEEFVDEGDRKDEELVNVLEKKQEKLGEGLCSTEVDENDGFRTPTSIEHRIPVPTECPPAPKKSCKRKFEGSSIAEIIRSATKAIHDQFMVFKKPRQDDDALS